MPWKFLTNHVSKQKFKLPLRWVLIVPLILQIVTIGALTTWLSLRNNEQAALEISSQIRTELTSRINLQLREYLEKPRIITQVNVNAVQLGHLNLQDKIALERFFAAQLLLFKSASQISLARSDGTLVSTGLRTDGSLLSKTTEEFPYVSIYDLNTQGDRLRQIRIKLPEDIRTESWYQSTLVTGKSIWTPIYPFNKYELGITATQPFYDKSGRLAGVMAVDLLLDRINKFLQQLKISNTGQAFIIEPSGALVATSTGGKTFTMEGDLLQRISASDSKNLLTHKTVEYLKSYFKDFSSINESQQLDFTIDGKRQLVQVRPYKDNYGLNWLIVVVLPEADFRELVDANTFTTITLCLIALGVAIVISVMTSRWITRPVLRLKEASKAIAAGKLDQKVSIEPIEELGAMATSFNKMANQLREAFADLEESNAYLSSILNNLKSGLLVIDLSNLVSCLNPAFQKMFGIDTLDIIGREYQDIIITPEILMLIQQVQSSPKQCFEFDVPLAENRIGHAIATTIHNIPSYPLSLTHPQPKNNRDIHIGIMVLVRDVTAEKELDNLKVDFLSSISHELRTPLVSILGFTKVIEKKFNEVILPLVELPAQTDKKVEKSIAQIQNNLTIVNLESQKLTSIITNVLDITNLEANKVVFNIQVFSVAEAIAKAVSTTEYLFQQKQLSLIVEVAKDLPPVKGDLEKIAQVIQHLLTNALHFTNEGQVICKAEHTDTEVIVKVIDTGIGIATSNLINVFEKFKQVGDILTDKPQGTGLGLPICKAIISNHGGRIWIESELHKGTSAIFTLPIIRE